MAKDMYEVMQNEMLRSKIIEGIKETASTKLWSWDQRFESEINAVERLFLE